MPLLVTAKMLGAAGLASYALARLSVHQNWFSWSRKHVVAVAVDRLPAMPSGFRVIELNAAELERHRIDIGRADQRARFDQGLVCLGAFNRKDVLCGVIWMTTAPCVEAGMPVRYLLPTGAAFDTGMWIAPAYRLGRCFAALWAGAAAWLLARGCSWSVSTIADYNFASIAAHRRLGATDLGRVTFAALGKRGKLRIPDGHGWRSAARASQTDWLLPFPGAHAARGAAHMPTSCAQ